MCMDSSVTAYLLLLRKTMKEVRCCGALLVLARQAHLAEISTFVKVFEFTISQLVNKPKHIEEDIISLWQTSDRLLSVVMEKSKQEVSQCQEKRVEARDA